MSTPNRGEQGATGKTGARGATGPASPTLKITDRRLLFAFAAVLAIFALLAWRNEVNTRRIQSVVHAQAVTNYNRCQRAVLIDNKINATARAQIAFLTGFVAHSPSPDQLNRYIDIYRHAMLPVPTCGRRP